MFLLIQSQLGDLLDAFVSVVRGNSRIRSILGPGICRMALLSATNPFPNPRSTARGYSWEVDRVLIAWAAVRCIVVILLILGFPSLESHDGFYFHHGGDQDYYFEYGRVLAYGNFDRYFAVNLGQPAIMAIAIRIFKPVSFSEILPVLVIVNGLLFGGMSVIVLGRLTHLLSGSARAGYIAAGLWAVMPWVMWIGFLPHPRREALQAPYVPGVAWLQGIPDGPAVFFALLALYLLVRWLDVPKLSWLIVSGTALGVMLLFRFQLVFILALAIMVTLIERRIRSSIGLAVVVALAYLPQVIYNRVSSTLSGIPNVIPWLPGYLYSGFMDPVSNEIYWKNPDLNFLLFVPGCSGCNSPQVQWPTTPLVWIVGAGFLLGAAWGVRAIFRRMGSGRAMIALAAPWAAIGVPMLSPIFLENVYRFSLPALPFLTLLSGVCGDLLWGSVQKWRSEVSD